MGWAEDLPEPAEAVSVLRHQQRNQGFRQVLQEPALLLDSWSWPLCKSCDISHSPRICFPSHVRVLNRDAPEWSWLSLFPHVISSLAAGACRPALYRAEHDQQHHPVSGQLVDFMWYAKIKWRNVNWKQLAHGHGRCRTRVQWRSHTWKTIIQLMIPVICLQFSILWKIERWCNRKSGKVYFLMIFVVRRLIYVAFGRKKNS